MFFEQRGFANDDRMLLPKPAWTKVTYDTSIIIAMFGALATIALFVFVVGGNGNKATACE